MSAPAPKIGPLEYYNRYATVVSTAAVATLLPASYTGDQAYLTYLECLVDNATLAVTDSGGNTRTIGPVLAGFKMIGKFLAVTASAGAVFVGRSEGV